MRDALINEYPALKARRLQLAWPGVDVVACSEVQNCSDVFLVRSIFVGKEWKRKGLRRAIDILEALRATNPNITLDVYGVESSDVPKKMRKKTGVRFMGWTSDIPWADYHLLIHPAEIEPFGMVVVEARSYGVLALISDRVGAADLAFNGMSVVSIDAPLSTWLSKFSVLLASRDRTREVKWTWGDLVDLHRHTVYPQLEAVIL